MPTPFRPTLDAGRTMNGSFGRILNENGQELTQYNNFSLKIAEEFSDIKVLGTRLTKHKLTGESIEGSISGYRVTSDLIRAILENPTRTFTFITDLDDPEAYGHERVRVRGVKFSSNPLINFKAGEVCEQEIPFVCDSYPELLDAVVQTGANVAGSVPLEA